MWYFERKLYGSCLFIRIWYAVVVLILVGFDRVGSWNTLTAKYCVLYSYNVPPSTYIGQSEILGHDNCGKRSPQIMSFLLACHPRSLLDFGEATSSVTICATMALVQEQLDHLLTGCFYSREVWFRVLCHLDCQQLSPASDTLLIPWWLAARKQVRKDRRKSLDSAVNGNPHLLEHMVAAERPGGCSNVKIFSRRA